MDITGIVTTVLPEESGEGKNGTWRKQEFIIETEGDYPALVAITAWGDHIDKFAIKAGEKVTAHIDIKSREYNSRWYTNVSTWKVDKSDAAAGTPPKKEEDDLPF